MHALVVAVIFALSVFAQGASVLTPAEQRIADRMKLRQLPDDQRATVTRTLALEIRALTAANHKVMLASDLANLATEGDFGRETLQEVTTTLEAALREASPKVALPAHSQLAMLVRYEGMRANLEGPFFAAAMRELEEADALRKSAQFTLRDLGGKEWNLASLRGKAVLVNFWATWCGPCRKEMPDLDVITKRFGKALVVLAISDEDAAKVKSYIDAHPYGFTVLLDPGRKVNETFRVEGIPKSFVFDREGKLVAQAMDMRTQQQFLAMLEKAGLK